MENWILLVIIVLIASLLQASTGYGFSIVGTPFLLIIYPAHTAIQINMILSLCLSLFMIFKIGNEVDKPLLFRLIKGSIAGLVLGLFIYLYIDVRLLKMAVGGLILILTVLLICQLSIHQTKNRDILSGGISGLLTTSIGVPGPPLLLYFSSVGTGKALLRSTTLAYYLFVYFISLIMQISFGGTSKEAWISSLIAVPSLLVGILLGQFLFKWISQRAFRIITYNILLFTGGYLIASSFWF
ncbi:sulfite exporter TauE/SafE family protein [Peribacillus cavernae]|uniref:Probable membrane transporter protein n=1 Tax=Peribacillus cavernae TaxID=1674310 RepID=A0A433HHZ9_9BACI|nr:sulfite exporter TauE/SafE family protein [Peribacillus cavernae]MDQ0219303.1 putative membrane protein YfcA [Peribacillus cavernae]RUQ27812.1 sulfite exporter TauE/SafE family protein [Peribacillus cavernae]